MYTHNGKTYLTWYDMDYAVSEIVASIKNTENVHLVGLARGSFNLIQVVSNQLNLPYTILQYSTYDGNDTHIKQGFSSKPINLDDNIVFLDDISDTGNSIRALQEYFNYRDMSIYTVVGKKTHPKEWNYIFEHSGWTVFPYEGSNFVECQRCKHSEPCNKYPDKIHCNLFDKSFNRDHSCKSGEL